MIKRMYCMSEVVGPVIPTPVARSPGGGEKREGGGGGGGWDCLLCICE